MSITQKHIYLIPGLGADERVFKNLRLEGYHKHFVHWIAPLPKESLTDYSKRLLAQVTHPNPILIGVSLGGLVGIEFAKHIKVEKLFIISSFKGQQELPFYYKIAGALRLYKLFSKRLLLASMGLFDWIFGIKEAGEKKLFRKIVKDTDEPFLIWSLEHLISWDNREVIPNLVHIHGTADRTLPIAFVKPNYTIENGGHFMVLNRAKEISAIIEQELNSKV